MGQKVLFFKNFSQDFKINFFETGRRKNAEIELKKTVTKVLKRLNKVFSSIKALKQTHFLKNIRYSAVGLHYRLMLGRKLFADNDFIILRLLGHSFYTLSRKHPFGHLCGYDIGN